MCPDKSWLPRVADVNLATVNITHGTMRNPDIIKVGKENLAVSCGLRVLGS